MAPARENDWVTGVDGFRARKSGQWAKVKLSFLDDIIPPSLQVTGKSRYPKRQRWYVDLFAGPGWNADRQTLENFPGSLLRSLPLSAQADSRVHFTHAVGVNNDAEDHAALVARVQQLRAEGRCPVPEGNTDIRFADANVALPEILGRIDVKAYALVVADITRPKHWPWTSVMQLHAQGHSGVDFYMLFPSHTAINRMMGWSEDAVRPNAPALNAFFGTDEWEEIQRRPRTEANAREIREAIMDLYVRRLKSAARFKHAAVVRHVGRRGGSVPLYRMIFATNSDVAAKFAEWSRKKRDRDDGGQPRFF